MDIYSLTFLETGSPKSMCQWGHAPSKGPQQEYCASSSFGGRGGAGNPQSSLVLWSECVSLLGSCRDPNVQYVDIRGWELWEGYKDSTL